MTDDQLQPLASLPEDLAHLVRQHIREMYPDVVKAAPSTFLKSVGNVVLNKANAVIGQHLDELDEYVVSQEGPELTIIQDGYLTFPGNIPPIRIEGWVDVPEALKTED